jgi:GH24 family phage-related lysozyme (muramidase)
MDGRSKVITHTIERAIFDLLQFDDAQLTNIDYEDYRSRIAEILIENQLGDSNLSQEQVDLLQKELNRVKNKTGIIEIKIKSARVNRTNTLPRINAEVSSRKDEPGQKVENVTIDHQVDEGILVFLKLKAGTKINAKTYFDAIKTTLASYRLVNTKLPFETQQLLEGELKRVWRIKDKETKTFNLKETKTKVSGDKNPPGTSNVSEPKTSAIIKSPVSKLSTERLRYEPKIEEVDVKDVTKKTRVIRTPQKTCCERIGEKLDSIISTLTEINNFETNRSEKERRTREKRSRQDRENQMESNSFKGIGKALSAITKPFQSIWDMILNYITNIILGKVFIKLLEWIADPDNQSKIKTIIEFLSDKWPILAALYLRFGTGFGRAIGSLSKILIAGSLKLTKAVLPRLLSFIGKRGAAAKVGNFLGTKGKLIGAGLQLATTAAVTIGTAKFLGDVTGKNESQQERTPPTQKYSGGGNVALLKFSNGGLNDLFGSMNNAPSSGMVKGPGGPKDDKVPAMLSDGEFVMSAGAVKKYGVETLESMNAAGGGTNVPQIANGITYAAGGGFVQTVSKHLKHDEALSSLSKGQNDYIKPGGKSVISGKAWNTISPQTNIHSYIDSVGQPTIGWGSTYYDSILNGTKPVKPGDTITKSKADNILNTNIMNLGKVYSKKIPTWNKMSDNQRAGVTLVGYNAPYGPIGAYRNLTSALTKGDMVSAATHVQRGGPSPSRIALERKLILSGPKDLSRSIAPQKPKETNSPPKNNNSFFGINFNPNFFKFQHGGKVTPIANNISENNDIRNMMGGMITPNEESSKKYQGGGMITPNEESSKKYQGGGMIKENSGSDYSPDGKKLGGSDRQYFSYFAQPGESRYIFTKKATEKGAIDYANVIQSMLDGNSNASKKGYDTNKLSPTNSSSPVRFSSGPKMRSPVTPLTRSTSKPKIIDLGKVSGQNRKSSVNVPSKSKPPSFSPLHPKGTSVAQSTLGVRK